MEKPFEISKSKAFCYHCERQFKEQQYVVKDLDNYYFCSERCLIRFLGIEQQRINIVEDLCTLKN